MNNYADFEDEILDSFYNEFTKWTREGKVSTLSGLERTTVEIFVSWLLENYNIELKQKVLNKNG